MDTQKDKATMDDLKLGNSELAQEVKRLAVEKDALLDACKEAQKVLLEAYEDDKGVDIFNAIRLLEQAINQTTK